MFEFLRTVLRMSTPLALIALGGTWTLQTGVLNIGQEGGLILAAFFAAWGNHLCADWMAGIGLAVAASLMYGFVFSVFCVNLRANIWVVGMTLNIFGDALSILFLKALTGGKGTFRSTRIQAIPDVHLSFLPSWLNDQSLLIWFCLVLVLIFLYFDRKTVFGLRLKAAGQNEDAVAVAGIRVTRLRWWTVALNSMLVGVAGAYLSTSYLQSFTKGMSANRGWMATAAVIFGDGSLPWTLFAVVLFGSAQALGIQLQTIGVPNHLALMLPYVLVVVVLVAKTLKKKK